MRNLLYGGLVVGTFDILYAISFWWLRAGVAPMRIFHSVAAGLLGRDAARAGGVPTAVLGGVLHYFIAFVIVIVYWLASRRMRVLVERPVLFGAIYGIGVYLVMNYIVIPLSAAPPATNPLPLWVACSVAVHAFLIGVPAALFARRAIRQA